MADVYPSYDPWRSGAIIGRVVKETWKMGHWWHSMNTGRFFSKQAFPAFILGAFFLLAGCGAVDTAEKDSGPKLAEKWGIEITGLRMTAANHMIDFRYRVLDAEKAASLFERKTKPYLIDQKSEKVLSVPNTAKVGPLRTSDHPQEGRIYWMFFGNSPGLVQSGNKVTVVIGDFRVENLIVQ